MLMFTTLHEFTSLATKNIKNKKQLNRKLKIVKRKVSVFKADL